MPNPLNTIAKSGHVYTVLVPGEEAFLIGQCEGKPVAFFFSQKKVATAYLATIDKSNHKVIKEEVKPLMEELIEVGVEQAFVDAEDPKALPDPLMLSMFLEHLAKQPAKV